MEKEVDIVALGELLIDFTEAELRKWAEGSKHVIFVDWTDKVEKYYSAMDVFCS